MSFPPATLVVPQNFRTLPHDELGHAQYLICSRKEALSHLFSRNLSRYAVSDYAYSDYVLQS